MPFLPATRAGTACDKVPFQPLPVISEAVVPLVSLNENFRGRQHGLSIREMLDLRHVQSDIIDPEVIHPSVEIGIRAILGAPDPVLRGGAHRGWFNGHRGIASHLNTVHIKDACRTVQGDRYMMPASGRQHRLPVNDLFARVVILDQQSGFCRSLHFAESETY